MAKGTSTTLQPDVLLGLNPGLWTTTTLQKQKSLHELSALSNIYAEYMQMCGMTYEFCSQSTMHFRAIKSLANV